MNILLNFFPVRAGGGQQVASSFIKIIAQDNYSHNWFFFVGEGSELYILASLYFPPERIFALPYSYYTRLTSSKRLSIFIKKNNVDIIYNYCPTLPIKKIPQVVRSVYSNLYFPEIDFWQSYPLSVRIKKKLIDRYRWKGTIKANGIIFENESMLERAINLFKYPSDQVKYIEPSISKFDETNNSVNYNYIKLMPEFKILYLSSWHLNKNIAKLPEVARLLANDQIQIKFILSLDRADPAINNTLLSIINNLEVNNYFEFIGKVNAIHVHQVVKNCDAMILLSKLECFSSNVIESFYFGKPLIISDEPWARAACKNAALYVEQENPNDIYAKIKELVNNRLLQSQLSTIGRDRIQSFNSPEEKVFKQLQFLKYIYDKNKKME